MQNYLDYLKKFFLIGFFLNINTQVFSQQSVSEPETQFGFITEISSPLFHIADETKLLNLDLRGFVQFNRLRIGGKAVKLNHLNEFDKESSQNNVIEPKVKDSFTQLYGLFINFSIIEFESSFIFFGGTAGQAMRLFNYTKLNSNDYEEAQSNDSFFGVQAGYEYKLNNSFRLALEYQYYFLNDGIDEEVKIDETNYKGELYSTLDIHQINLLVVTQF